MNDPATTAVAELDRRFLLDYPWEAARRIESLEPRAVLPALAAQNPATLLEAWRRLAPGVAADLILRLPPAHAGRLLSDLLPQEAARIIERQPSTERESLLALVAAEARREIQRLMSYPEDSAGRIMDPGFVAFRGDMTAADALRTLRKTPARTTRSLFLIDDHNRLVGRATIQAIAVAPPTQPLLEIAEPVVATVLPVSAREEVADAIDRYRLADLPVVDAHGVPVGVIYHADLVHAIQEEATADLQSMVGASRSERALSAPLFAVRKRLPWLQINLLTAFLAAAVVGLFESTIAKFTALAVLLPVVAGQSGNAGAQALAVTMRGLTLREVSIRQWLAITAKEAGVGLLNGIAIAVTCGIGVWLWSRSLGLVVVIMLSMVIAMVVAGLAGAVVPMALTRLGQDPAQSSSIVLTTVTDVAGFFSFLGIATALSWLL
jgi:magnesium transporter